jgi:3-mercaptopyruvate sulfurtransferase SseA
MKLRAGVLAVLAAGVPPLLAQEKPPPAPAAAAPAAPAPAAPAASDATVVERIPLDELKKLMATGKVLVVDVRSLDAYKSGHIPGSVSAPLSEIEKHVPELKSAKKPLVTYCS